jgi:hypothetical protein
MRAAEQLRELAAAGAKATEAVDGWREAIVDLAIRARPLDLSLLALFAGLVRCRVDDCDGTATGVYELGNLTLAMCPACLAKVGMGRLVRRSR